MPDRSADMPFHFVSCMELRESLGKRAQDLQRLLEIIEEVPAESIYYHPQLLLAASLYSGTVPERLCELGSTACARPCSW
jgi:uncharacterized protein DUF5752